MILLTLSSPFLLMLDWQCYILPLEIVSATVSILQAQEFKCVMCAAAHRSLSGSYVLCCVNL